MRDRPFIDIEDTHAWSEEVKTEPRGYNAVSGHSSVFPREVLAVAAINPRFLVDARQTPIDVVVTIEEWRSIVEELEELEDIRAYDAAVAEKQESTPLERVAVEIRERREP